MSSLFSPTHVPEQPSTLERRLAPPMDVPEPARAAALPAPMMDSAPSQQEALAAMLATLRDYLPAGEDSLPSSSISAVTVIERPVGLGNFRGLEPSGSFSAVALKGGRLDAVVRYQIWRSDPGDVEAAADELHAHMLNAKESLRSVGFLSIGAEASSVSEPVAALGAWRKSVDYRVLYEYHYRDSDAESLIARIPVDIDGVHGESTAVTDDMVHWDDLAAPELVVRRGERTSFRVDGLFILAFLPPGWDGDVVIVSAVFDGVDRSQSYASTRRFVEAFAPEMDGVDLGQRTYLAARLAFPNTHFPEPIVLREGNDLLRVHYSAPAFDDDAVIYLQAVGY